MQKVVKFSMGLMAGLLLSSVAMAQQFVYPAKGQSAEKQAKDEAECHTWAVKQAGYDPAKPVAAQAPQQTGPSGSRLRGAAAGVTVAAITDHDKGDAAVAGAVGAASAERGAKRRAAKQQQQVTGEANKTGTENYQKARAVCLEGRGYTVK